MRDIAVMLMLLGSIALALRRPWLGVLALAVFGYMNPHRYAWGFSTEFPVYTVLFVAVAISFLINGRDRQPIPNDWRVATFYRCGPGSASRRSMPSIRPPPCPCWRRSPRSTCR
jgi:hypothetical protein